MINRKKVDKALYYLFWLLFIIGIVYLFVYLNNKMNCFLDSDMSSELVYAKLLNEEHSLLSSNWFYSTEIRILYMQLIFAPLFSFTNNWHIVRIVGTYILIILLLASLYYLLYSLDMKKSFPLIALFFILPLSEDYFYYVLSGAFYISHLIILFLSISLTLQCIKSTKKKKSIYMTILAILSFLAGLGGFRLLFCLYIPLVISSLFLVWTNHIKIVDLKDNDKFKLFIISMIQLVFAFIGCIINRKIFASHYSFLGFGELSFTGFSLKGFETTINAFLTELGYTWSKVFSLGLINNVFVFFILFISIISFVKTIRKQNKQISSDLIVLFSLFSILLNIFLYSFTNMDFVAYHNILACMLLIINVFVYIKEESNSLYKYSYIIVLVILLLFHSTYQYKIINKTDKTASLIDVCEVLEKEKIHNGYATFWNANVLTELSNGDIDVWSVGDYRVIDKDLEDVDHIYQVLQKVSHVKEKPASKLFVLLTNEEKNKLTLGNVLDESHILYKNDKYTLYTYNEYSELEKDINS